MVYLEKTLPEAEFIRTQFSDDVRFTEEKMNLVYMGSHDGAYGRSRSSASLSR